MCSQGEFSINNSAILIHSSPDNPNLNRSKESIGSDLDIDFDDPQRLDAHLSINKEKTMDVDIEIELELFDPEPMSTDKCIFEYWNSRQKEHKNLYTLATCIYAIPPTEVEVERDFSQLNFVFTQRRQSLSEENLEAILLIHLNKDLFYVIKEVELAKIKPCE